MWSYEQISGRITKEGVGILATGYSGAPGFKNDPNQQGVKDKGPIPRGRYTIQEPRVSTRHGRYALPLVPDPLNNMFGRDLFWIHGERMEGPSGCASEGCIILPLFARERLWESGDHDLQVVAELEMTA